MISEQDLIADEHEEIEAEESLQELEAKREADQVEEEEPLAEALYFDAIVALQQILEGQDVDVARVGGLDDAERGALEFFRQVVTGRTDGNEFIYAEKRLEALNHVLAVLQPILSVGGAHDVLHASLQEVVDGIEALRTRLTGLEDAEEEVFHVADETQATGADDQDDDKPSNQPPADAKSDDKAKAAAARAAADKAAADKAQKDDDLEHERRVRKPSTLSGTGTEPPVPDDKPRPSAWNPDDRGPAVERPAQTSTAWNPDDRSAVPEPRPTKSTAWDPDDRGGGGR